MATQRVGTAFFYHSIDMNKTQFNLYVDLVELRIPHSQSDETMDLYYYPLWP